MTLQDCSTKYLIKMLEAVTQTKVIHETVLEGKYSNYLNARLYTNNDKCPLCILNTNYCKECPWFIIEERFCDGSYLNSSDSILRLSTWQRLISIELTKRNDYVS